jgi:arginine deiminase
MLPTYIKSDISKLRKVIVHSPTAEIKHVIPKFGWLSKPGFSADIIGSDAIEQHSNFVEILKNNDVEVLTVSELINSALENLKSNKSLEHWITTNFPKLAKFDDINADDLVGASMRSFYNFEDGVYKPLSEPLNAMYYVRDWGVMTPRGLILSNLDKNREAENNISRLIFKHTPELSNVPLLLDCLDEGLTLQGGDVIVFDEETLFIGVGNKTREIAASEIAKRLNLTVFGITLPASDKNTGKGTPFSSLFLHLDTVFNLIDKDKALLVPYFFDDSFNLNNPIYALFDGMMNNLSENLRKDLTDILNELKSVGEVYKYCPGTGKKVSTGMKLANFLREELEMKIISVGGSVPDNSVEQLKHLIETVIPETRFQAGNIVVIKPNDLLMYKENTKNTQLELKKSGLNVRTLQGYELSKWNGGPHCMTLPLERF